MAKSTNRKLILNGNSLFGAGAASYDLQSGEIISSNAIAYMTETAPGSGWWECVLEVDVASDNTFNLYVQMDNAGSDSNYVGDGSTMDLYDLSLTRLYKNPLFHRELNKNGILHRADRLNQYNQIITTPELAAVETYHQTIEG